MDTRALLALLGTLFLSAPAGALTLLQLSGSGDITIDVTGQVFLDAGDSIFESITLEANAIDTAVPPGSPDTILSLSGLADYDASVADDLRLEILSWTGTLSLTASETIFLDGGLFVEPPDGSPGTCGVIIGGGSPGSVGPCESVVIVAPPGGPIVVIPGTVIPGTVIPEPSAAVVFALGLALLAPRAAYGRA